MFDRIAPLYDVMNTVMTAGTDARWRRTAIRAAVIRPGMRVLDVACGTGKLTRAAAEVVGDAGEAVGVDFSPRMLEAARRVPVTMGGPAGRTGAAATPRYVEADALVLPFPDGSFDAVTMAFGLRNVSDYRAALSEMRRVAAAGGRVVVLEIGVPESGAAGALYRLWFRRGVPLLGRLLGRRGAYAYLPASVAEYPRPAEVAELMGEVGLRDVRWAALSGGFVTLHRGIRE